MLADTVTGTTVTQGIAILSDAMPLTVETELADYVLAGMALVAIPRGFKAPCTKEWQLECNTIRTREGVAALDGCNVGLAHRWSGTCAIDVDDFQKSSRWFMGRGIDLAALLAADDAVQVSSERVNRAKLIYRLPAGVSWLPTHRIEGIGLELRCATRDGLATVQDVLPPSIHPDTGKPYIWTGAGDWRALPTLPAALLALWRAVRAPGNPVRVTSSVAQSASNTAISEGGRNSYLTSLAGTMRCRGMDQAAIEAALIQENAAKCVPPILEAEARAIAASVARYAPGQTTPTEWPEPCSLERGTTTAEPYPLDALPDGIRGAVAEYQSYGQQPVALVASSAMAVVSLAAQGLADVSRDSQLRGPLSLNFLILAQSGERKTAADRALGLPLSAWESDRALAMRDDIAQSRGAHASWQAVGEGIKNAIKTAAKNKPEQVAVLRQRLQDHELDEPTVLVAPRLRYEDVNPQSLPHMLATGHPSAALWSDEGGIVTGSQGMGRDSLLGFMAILNRLWEGGAIHQDRKQAESVHAEGRRLTVSLMVQPAILCELTQRSDGLARGSGFLARFLVAAPTSTMGQRPYQEPPPGIPRQAAFHRRIRELLDCDLPLDDRGRLTPADIKLSPGAFCVWREYHDQVERELAPLGDFACIADFAAKSADNAVRIAGCLHMYAGSQGAMQSDTMQRAVRLAYWYLRETLRVLDLLDEPQEWADARLLDSWLEERSHCAARDVLRFGPSPLRDRTRRDAAVAVLTEQGRARLEREGRRETLVRNPSLRRPATATLATPATVSSQVPPPVAEVATVAVADAIDQETERGEL